MLNRCTENSWTVELVIVQAPTQDKDNHEYEGIHSLGVEQWNYEGRRNIHHVHLSIGKYNGKILTSSRILPMPLTRRICQRHCGSANIEQYPEEANGD